MEFLFKIGNGWEWSKIYFDSKNEVFIREHYHEGYLDSETVCDGSKPISDVDLWKIIVSEANFDGIQKYIEIRHSVPKLEKESGIAQQEFFKLLHSLKCEKPYFSYSAYFVDKLTVIYDESETILGVLSKSEHFWLYINQSNHGFNTKEEAFKYIIEDITRCHERRMYNEGTQKEGVVTEPIIKEIKEKKGLFSHFIKK